MQGFTMITPVRIIPAAIMKAISSSATAADEIKILNRTTKEISYQTHCSAEGADATLQQQFVHDISKTHPAEILVNSFSCLCPAFNNAFGDYRQTGHHFVHSATPTSELFSGAFQPGQSEIFLKSLLLNSPLI